MRHELAHVVLGRDAAWPLNLPAAWGVFPHAALVEGAAEALEWSSSDYTLHQWSAALIQLGIAVDIEALMGASAFYIEPPGKAYTLSGSFMRWLLDTRGPAAFRDVYRDADFRRVYGTTLATLARDWRAFLGELDVPEGIEAEAKLRYDRKALFFRVCPLESARMQVEVMQHVVRNEDDEALDSARTLLSFNPQEPRTQLRFTALLAELGRLAEAQAMAEAARGRPDINAPMLARFDLFVGDAAWRSGAVDIAEEAYRRVQRAPIDPTLARVCSVKRAIVSEPEREAVLGPYLLGRRPAPGTSREAWVEETVAYLYDVLIELQHDPLAHYLLGRLLVLERRYAEALGPLRTSLALLRVEGTSLDTHARGLLRDELQRMEGIALLEVGDVEQAAERFKALAGRANKPGQALRYQEWVERALWKKP